MSSSASRRCKSTLGKRLESMATMDAALHTKPKLTLKESFMKFLFDLLFKLLNRPPMPF